MFSHIMRMGQHTHMGQNIATYIGRSRLALDENLQSAEDSEISLYDVYYCS